MRLEENIIRKWWLVLFFVSMAISIVTAAFTQTPDLGFSPTAMKVMKIVGWGFGLLFWWTTYHFAYVKRGTKWLLILIIGAIYSVTLYVLLLLHPQLLSTYFPARNLPWLSVAQVFINLLWAIACYLLYKANRARQESEEAPGAAKAQNAIDSLSNQPVMQLTWAERLLLKETSIRRAWIISYALVVLTAIYFLFDKVLALVSTTPLSFEQFSNASSALFAAAVILWLSYYLAYIRRGTKWLMAIVLIGFVVEGLLLYFWQADRLYQSSIGLTKEELFLVFFVTLTFQVSSFLLYLVNRTRKNLQSR